MVWNVDWSGLSRIRHSVSISSHIVELNANAAVVQFRLKFGHWGWNLITLGWTWFSDGTNETSDLTFAHSKTTRSANSSFAAADIAGAPLALRQTTRCKVPIWLLLIAKQQEPLNLLLSCSRFLTRHQNLSVCLLCRSVLYQHLFFETGKIKSWTGIL